MRFCIDTDFAIAILKKLEIAKTKLKEIEASDEIAITSMSVFELLFATRGLSEARRIERDQFIATFNVLSFDEVAARKAAEIHEELTKKGEAIELPNLFIASIALTKDCILITQNIKHYSRIKNLKIEPW